MRNIRSVLSLALLASVSLALMPPTALMILMAVPARSATAPPNGGWDAAWSPDGARIAFTSGSPHNIPNLWVINADKSGLRPLTTRGAHEPQWLPDGKTIVFGTIRNGKSVAMQIDADGALGSEKPVDVLPVGAESPVWSPNGALVAYGVPSQDEMARDLSFARTNGGGATGLTSKFWCREWAWSPDGTTIAFTVGKSAGTSIWTVDLATKDVKLLYKGYCRAPAYSPDGKRLAFAVPDIGSGFRPVIVDLATGLSRPLSVQSFNGEKIIWSRDGSRLYIQSSPKAEPAVWSVVIATNAVARLTPKGTPSMDPALSPKGDRIACQVITSKSYSPELCLYDTSGKVISHLTASSSPSFWAPVWSPNGREIAFQSDADHNLGLYIGTADGRMGKPSAPISSLDPAGVSWFPDGSGLLLNDAGRLQTVKKAGGKDAATPLPRLTTAVEGAQLDGNEVIFTEWGLRNASLTAIKLDGTGRRAVTQRPTGMSPGAPGRSLPAGHPGFGSHGAPAHPMPAAPAAPAAPATPVMSPVMPAPAATSVPADHPVKKAAYRSQDGPLFVLASGHLDAPVTSKARRNGSAPVASNASGNGSAPVVTLVAAETGNPHAGLGMMGPQENVDAGLAPPVIDIQPAISPDRKVVAFLRNDQVFLVNADGTGERQLTKFSTDGTATRTLASPSWSRDGSSILFMAFSSADGKMLLELWTSGTEAGSERLIYSEPVDTEFGVYYADCTSAPAFTPDGKRVLFTSLTTGEPRIVSIARDGSDLREVVPAPSSYPALDATGSTLAYVDLSSFRERIHVRDMATGRDRGPLYKK